MEQHEEKPCPLCNGVIIFEGIENTKGIHLKCFKCSLCEGYEEKIPMDTTTAKKFYC